MWISVNNFGFKPKIVPLLFNRLIFVETVELYSSNFFGDAMLVHEVYKLVSYLQLSQKTRHEADTNYSCHDDTRHCRSEQQLWC